MNFEDALQLAAKKHAGQLRRDGTPYIWHPIAVAGLLREAGFNEKHQITGLFHDLLEDTDATGDEIAAFGADILEAVKCLTKESGIDEVNYVERILKNEMAATVKAADRIHNLLDAIHGAGATHAEEARSFLGWYLKQSQKFYRGRFCQALDKVIGLAETACHNDENTVIVPNFDFCEDFELYAKKEVRLREERLASTAGHDMPDLTQVDFFRIDDDLYCRRVQGGNTMDPEKIWYLSDVGWIEVDLNLWDYMEEIEGVTDEYLKQNGIKRSV